MRDRISRATAGTRHHAARRAEESFRIDRSPQALCRERVSAAIAGAMTASQLYVGDKLNLYERMDWLCSTA